MNKILGYELRRLLWSRMFLGLLGVSILYGWQLLRGEIILGVANTAPFSPWSFGSYLSRMLPLLSLSLLFFLWNQHSQGARGVKPLTAATPIEPGRYLLLRSAAVLLAWLLMALFVMGLGLGFLLALFYGDVPCASLLVTSVITLLPPMVFLLGVGSLLGGIHRPLLLPLMVLALGAGLLPLPAAIDLYGTAFFLEYPLTLGVLDPALSIPPAVVGGKLVFTLLGAACCVRSITMDGHAGRGK